MIDVNILRIYWKNFQKKNEDIVGFWTYFFDNTFDNKDSEYKNIDIYSPTGNFLVVCYNIGNILIFKNLLPNKK